MYICVYIYIYMVSGVSCLVPGVCEPRGHGTAEAAAHHLRDARWDQYSTFIYVIVCILCRSLSLSIYIYIYIYIHICYTYNHIPHVMYIYIYAYVYTHTYHVYTRISPYLPLSFSLYIYI